MATSESAIHTTMGNIGAFLKMLLKKSVKLFCKIWSKFFSKGRKEDAEGAKNDGDKCVQTSLVTQDSPRSSLHVDDLVGDDAVLQDAEVNTVADETEVEANLARMGSVAEITGVRDNEIDQVLYPEQAIAKVPGESGFGKRSFLIASCGAAAVSISFAIWAIASAMSKSEATISRSVR